jgi:hypothetical protein
MKWGFHVFFFYQSALILSYMQIDENRSSLCSKQALFEFDIGCRFCLFFPFHLLTILWYSVLINKTYKSFKIFEWIWQVVSGGDLITSINKWNAPLSALLKMDVMQVLYLLPIEVEISLVVGNYQMTQVSVSPLVYIYFILKLVRGELSPPLEVGTLFCTNSNKYLPWSVIILMFIKNACEINWLTCSPMRKMFGLLGKLKQSLYLKYIWLALFSTVLLICVYFWRALFVCRTTEHASSYVE